MSQVKVERIHTLTGHRDCIYTLQGSSEEHTFFSGSGDGMVVRWNLQDPETGDVIAKLPNSVYALHHHPYTDLLIAGHNYEGIHILSWKNKKEISSLQLTKAAIFDIQHLGKNDLLVASGDGVLSKVRMDQLVITKKNQASEKSARTIAVNEVTGDIAVGYSDNFIRVFDEDLILKAEWQAHANSVFTLRYMPESNLLMSGSRDARLKVWDGDVGYSQAAEIVAHMYAINHIDFSADGKHFVTCSMDKSIKVWDTEALTLLKVIDRARHAGHGTSVNKLFWTSYNNQLLSASDDRTISVWHIIF
ncbi:WD40 repeat domain-containing protein [Chryseosolibacter indicus]|uniref:WD40 repeat domain-containing protein n=1 Tax=Chryseosolibacter indicus TaxID=2782351 RepID=A0ABS5VSY0_9BACT|nr:WD40 repeat domain-containing protein [Chryseosolibacter indicus]MBT1703879.1 WD40 repeat domain-containing protein [Chryseosolibacter indicus]